MASSAQSLAGRTLEGTGIGGNVIGVGTGPESQCWVHWAHWDFPGAHPADGALQWVSQEPQKNWEPLMGPLLPAWIVPKCSCGRGCREAALETSSRQAWAGWDEASGSGLLLTSTNFRPFRTETNDNTLPGKRKKIPLGLCKISSELTVPLSFLLCGAAWLVNALGLSKHPLLPPLQGEPTHPNGQSLLSTSLGSQQEKIGQDRQKHCQWEGRGGGNLSWHGRPPSVRAVGWRTVWSL